MSGRESRRKAYNSGLWAEAMAALYLCGKGYRVLKSRYKTGMGEIDLVAVRGKTLVFIEVKARASAEDGLYAVSPQAQGRITRAAQHFIAGNPRFAGYDVRFDVIVYAGRFSITHLDNAWLARS